MARSRNIKPAIMDNEELAALPALTRLLFIYMWMLADREGRIEDRPGRIKKQALGYDDGNAEEMLCQLQSAGFIDRYEVAGVRVIQVLNFAKHQTPHMREAVSELPSKVLAPVENTESTNLGSALHQTGTDLGSAEASPRSPDSGFLIPDSPYLIPDTKGESAARTPTAKKPPPPSIAKPDDVDAQTWADWVQLRKAKRTTASQTAVDGARVEAEKAGMPLVDFLKVWCRRGSQGLEASWLKDSEKPTRQQPVSFKQADAEAGWARWEEMTGRQHPDRVQQTGRVIDITPKFQEIAR